MFEYGVCSLNYRKELSGCPVHGSKIDEAAGLSNDLLTSMLKKTLGHPKYQRNRWTDMILDIMSWDDFTPKQRACLEIHYAKEMVKLVEKDNPNKN